MTACAKVVEFLEERKIPFTTFTHHPAFTAQEEAAVSHVPGRDWAKTVVCVADGNPVLVVLPASRLIDFERLRRLTGAETIRLASKAEMERLYPGCELGMMPPFGPLFHQPVFVDSSLVGDPALVFNAGDHTTAIRMHYNDFAEMVEPVVGSFSCAPDDKPGTM